MKGGRGPDGMYGPGGLAKQLSKALVERAMRAPNLRFALTEQPGYEKNGAGGKPAENRRNGRPSKALWTDQGAMEIEAPCGREGGGEPETAPKRQRELCGFDGKTLPMYVPGLPAKSGTVKLKRHIQCRRAA
jgi:putative transposase